MASNWALASIWAMDSRGAGGDGCGNSRLALPSDSELANGVGLRSRDCGQHDSLPLAGTESRAAGDAIGPRAAAAFRTGPQPRCRRLETGRRLGSLSRSAATALRAHRHNFGCGSNGAGRGHLERAGETNALEHRAFASGAFQSADARIRGIVRRSAVDKNSVRRGHGAYGVGVWDGQSDGENLAASMSSFMICHPIF